MECWGFILKNIQQDKGEFMEIEKGKFFNAKNGDRFIGKNKLTWTVEGTGSKGGMLCKSPHTDEVEEVFLRKGKLIDSEDYPIEEFEEGVEYILA